MILSQNQGKPIKVLIVSATGRLGRMMQMGVHKIAPAALFIRFLTLHGDLAPPRQDAVCQWQHWSGHFNDPSVFHRADVVLNFAGLTPTAGGAIERVQPNTARLVYFHKAADARSAAEVIAQEASDYLHWEKESCAKLCTNPTG